MGFLTDVGVWFSLVCSRGDSCRRLEIKQDQGDVRDQARSRNDEGKGKNEKGQGLSLTLREDSGFSL